MSVSSDLARRRELKTTGDGVRSASEREVTLSQGEALDLAGRFGPGPHWICANCSEVAGRLTRAEDRCVTYSHRIRRTS